MEQDDEVDPGFSKWFIKKGQEIQGPLPFDDISFMIRAREISKKDHIRAESDQDWIQICDFPNFEKTFSRSNGGAVESLMPDGTDAVFILGLFAFFIGIFVLFFNVLIGIIVLVLSVLLESGGIIYSFKFKEEGTAKTVGNVVAIIWTCFQVLATIFVMMIKFS